MIGCGNVTEFPCVPYTVSKLYLDLSGIKEIPPWISDLYGLKELSMAFCSDLREISPKICELEQLESLNFKGCYNVREFPAEIFQSFCQWHALELTLINIGENSLPMYTAETTYDFPLNLDLAGNDFESIPDSVVRQACVVLPPGDELDDVPFRLFQISCYVRGRHSTTVYKWPEIYVNESDETDDRLLENHLFILNSYFTLEEDNIPESEMLFDFKCLGIKVYPDTISSNIFGCGVQLLEPCSCEYDSVAHPELSTLPLEEEDEGNNNSMAVTRRSNKRERSSVAEGLERTSKNLRISN
ncbi:unnamed protein product [Arabidopsis arenosa]|uniref:Disease resistance protein n=1 Tax=Arabidopsis arenosa TaxID=38785 RepID=A0A8S2AQ82_ARAAE|nr:unnamed protein product [Arabidopsis arenosa]